MAKILIVDDCEDISTLLKTILKQDKHSIKISKSGDEAVKYLKDQNFDLVITDVLMPDMDGFELSRFIREELPEPNCKTPIIAMSGGGVQVRRNVALAAIGIHANLLLKKPFSAKEMQSAVNTMLAA